MGYLKLFVLSVIAIGLFQIPSSEGARILGIFPFPIGSHLNVYLPLMKELAIRGHEVTLMVSIPTADKPKNFNEILLDLDYRKKLEESQVTLMDLSKMRQYEFAFMMFGVGQAICNQTMKADKVQELIKTKEKKYDLLVTSVFFTECILGFQHKFDIPLVQICTFHGNHWLFNMMGSSSDFATIPDTYLSFSNRMTFHERVINYLTGLLWLMVRNFNHVPAINRQLQENFGPDTPSMKTLEERTSLLLLNSDISFTYARPLTPNIVNVGGMHVKPAKPLPEDIKKWIEKAKHGVVYFSMGSNIKSHELPNEMRDALLKVFGELKQQVLWKWDDESLQGKLPNVRIEKWLPQNDILGHPNVKLFLTHGGLLSTQEATYHGNPLVGIPVMADQAVNMRRVQTSGMGVVIDLTNVTETSLRWGLNEVLNNPSYTKTAKRLSEIYRDQPQKPLDRAVYWVEYVIRHKGAPQLSPSSKELYWYQRELVDVVAFLIVLLLIPIFMLKSLINVICKLCGSKSKKEPTTSKSKKRN